MGRKLKILLSLPRTIIFNLCYLPLHQAVKLPIWLAPNVRVRRLTKCSIKLKGNVRPFYVRIGYHEADGVDTYSAHTILDIHKGGKLVFNGDAHVGQGAIFVVKEDGVLTLGRHFAISGTTSIICSKAITFGDDVQLSWNSLIMDSDAHKIYDEDGRWINPPCDITIGNKVWIAANTNIAKGAVIGDNTVVASNSLVNKQFAGDNNILAGCPAKIIKHIGHFNI